MSDKVITHWKGNALFEADNPSGKTLLMDTTPKDGEFSAGLRPKALMLASLAGCSGLDVAGIIDKMRIKVSDFRIDITGELTEVDPKYYHKVSVEYHFYGADLAKEKIQKAVDLSVEKYCGVMEMFRKFAEVQISVHYHE